MVKLASQEEMVHQALVERQGHLVPQDLVDLKDQGENVVNQVQQALQVAQAKGEKQDLKVHLDHQDLMGKLELQGQEENRVREENQVNVEKLGLKDLLALLEEMVGISVHKCCLAFFQTLSTFLSYSLN